MGDWFDSAGVGSAVDVPALLDSEAGALLHTVCGYGALVSLATTSDSGALGITITVDGRGKRQYFRKSEDLLDWLTEGLADIRAAAEEARSIRATSAPRRGRRGA